MNRLLTIMTAAALAATGCGPSHNDEPTPPTPPAQKEASRTVLVYMVANNNLGEEGWADADISEMRTAAATGGLGEGRLVVMHQSEKNKSVLKEVNSRGKIDTLAVYDSTEPSVSIARMRRVFEDMRELAPAKSYGLVLWSHGTGWVQDGMAEGGKRAFGVDGNKQMNVTSLARALDGQDFDFVYFDCCHMASVEVAYELRRTTPLIAGSATELPKAGMPYDENIPMLMQGNVADAAANTFRYYDAMSGSGRSCTISVIATDKLDDLAEATRQVYAMASPLPEGTLPQAFERTGKCRLFDIEDYMERIATDDAALQHWKDALERSVVYAAATPKVFNTLTIRRHCGLSTYVVKDATSMNDRGYGDLQWAADVATALPWSK